MTEFLPSKFKALSSNPKTAKTKTKSQIIEQKNTYLNNHSLKKMSLLK
jgi:hypothetical protein